jgi:drug/metabolite transporter (DMT)-like permease
MSKAGLMALGAPALFVFLWSTGFISAKLGLPHVEPMTFLALRFAIVALGFLGIVLWLGLRWPSPAVMAQQMVSGLLLHGVYLGGVFAAIDQGVEAGAAALVVGLQPLLVAAVAAPLLGETVGRRHWLGLALGILGVWLVVAEKLGDGMGTAAGVAFAVAALFGITAGTLYQKRVAGGIDIRVANVLQFAAAAAATGLAALAFETRAVDWQPAFIVALSWSVVVLSFGAVSLLLWLIAKGAASRVSSLFFLVPPTTALMAWLLFDERLPPLAMAGMALAVLGVALVNLPAARASPHRAPPRR